MRYIYKLSLLLSVLLSFQVNFASEYVVANEVGEHKSRSMSANETLVEALQNEIRVLEERVRKANERVRAAENLAKAAEQKAEAAKRLLKHYKRKSRTRKQDPSTGGVSEATKRALNEQLIRDLLREAGRPRH